MPVSRRLRLLVLTLLMVLLSTMLASCGLFEIFVEALSRICERPLAVTTYDDKNDGVCLPDDCSLREAVVTANRCEGRQEIRLPVGVFELSLAGRGEEAAASGDLDITDDVDIIGDSAPRPEPRVVIDGAGLDRVFEVHEEVEATFQGLVIRNGDADNLPGGGIFAHDFSSIELLTVHLLDNQAMNQGGGMFAMGQVAVEDSVFRGNQVGYTGGSGWFGGGGLFLHPSGSISVFNSVFEANRATDAQTGGGGLFVRGPAELAETVIEGNEAGQIGGGLASADDLTLRLVTVEDNVAGAGGGGVDQTAGNAFTQIIDSQFNRNRGSIGGGLYTWSRTEIHSTQFRGNIAERDGGGLHVASFRADETGTIVPVENQVLIADSLFEGNEAGDTGSAISNATGYLIMRETNVEENIATGPGGAAVFNEARFEMTAGRISRNQSLAGYIGYGLRNFEGEARLTGVMIAENRAGPGAPSDLIMVGVASDGELFLTDVQILNQDGGPDGFGVGLQNGTSTATAANALLSGVLIQGHNGRAIYSEYESSDLTMNDSELSQNPGGAIANGGVMNVRGTTIGGNIASRLDYGPQSCSIILNFGHLHLENSTVGENAAGGPDCKTLLNAANLYLDSVTLHDNEMVGILTDRLSFTPTFALFARAHRSIVAGNDPSGCGGPLTTLGNNLFDDTSCGPDTGLGDVVSSDPLGIRPLADNGGPTPTMALQSTSPAVDTGGATCLATDQRGYGRPGGSACDIGAFELDADPSGAAGAGTEEPDEAPDASPSPAADPLSINFNADRYSLPLGECTRIRWEVQNAETVALDGESVPATEAEQVCPQQTTTYRLMAANASEQAEATVTIEVTEPLLTPPAAPTQLGIGQVTCNANTYSVPLNWVDNADNEDGFRVYRNGQLLATLGSNVDKYTDGNAPATGSPVTYGVEAFNDAGASSRPTVQEPGCLF
ncbi:MAG TPA: CSLREA domain-containing protein [Anaerolineales bacterium]